MSLINEALKKAQQQRSGGTPPLGAMPAIGGESAARIARRGKPAAFNTLLLRLGGGGAILLILVVGGVFLLRNKSPEPVTPAQPTGAATAPVSAPKPVESLPMPVSATPPAPVAATITPAVTPQPFVVPPPATVKAEPAAQGPVVLEPAPPRTEPVKAEPARPVVPPVVIAPSPPPAEPVAARPAGPAKLDPRAINFIETLHVAGIRASTADAKVLMNDRVYRIGSIVERELGLKLTGITANSLTFEDEHGASYTRTF